MAHGMVEKPLTDRCRQAWTWGVSWSSTAQRARSRRVRQCRCSDPSPGALHNAVSALPDKLLYSADRIAALCDIGFCSSQVLYRQSDTSRCTMPRES